jgi:hypothetical protein
MTAAQNVQLSLANLLAMRLPALDHATGQVLYPT